MYSFAGLIRRTPPPTFSDTAITDRNFPAQSTLGADILVYRIEKIVRTCAVGWTLDSLRERRTPYPLGQALCYTKKGKHRIIIYLASAWLKCNCQKSYFHAINMTLKRLPLSLSLSQLTHLRFKNVTKTSQKTLDNVFM